MTVTRRRTLRVARELSVEWQAEDHSGRGRTLNVSAAGLLLRVEGGNIAAAPFDVTVALPSGAVTMRVEPCFSGPTRHGAGVGLAIIEIAPADHARWLAHYRELADHVVAGAPHSLERYLRARTQTDELPAIAS